MLSLNHLIDIALKEDIGHGDVTTDNLVSHSLRGKGLIVAKEPLVLAGIDVVRQVFSRLDPNIIFNSNYNDGDSLKGGEKVLGVEGKLRDLLKGERTALNFLQRLSGIATNVRGYVKTLGANKVRLVDTRKTTPGWRSLEKFAVRIGGAHNHRMGLFDGVLIKDNHIAIYGNIRQAVQEIRKKIPHLLKVEVEASSLSEVREAVDSGADVIMLDNMNINQIKDALVVIDGACLVEISGRVTKNDLPVLAALGVDIISLGALTHSARFVDLSMQINRLEV